MGRQFIFTLPEEQLAECELISDEGTSSTTGNVGGPAEAEPTATCATTAVPAGVGGSTCLVCGVLFASLDDQRTHFRTDFHRLNVKRKVAGLAPLGEAACERLLADDASSLSGSDTDDSDDEYGPSTSAHAARPVGHGREPKTLFRWKDDKGAEAFFSVWTPVLYPDTHSDVSRGAAEVLGALTDVALRHAKWALVLNRGGHFAAAVFDVRTKQRQGTNFAVLEHKTFHRYVTRQGQGGRQSTQDKTGKYAKSMGSQLRRHNEASLERDITETLTAWAPHFAACDLVFVHAPAGNSKPVFGPGRLDRTDARVRRIPFTTSRPTFKEVQRCVALLASADEVSVHEAAAATRATAKTAPSVRPPPSAKHEQPAAPPVQTHQKVHQPDTSTALHRAAAAGNAALVKQLLEFGGDPTQRDGAGRVPYEVAASKAARDAFRLFMASAPDQWDYQDARVPSALTDDMQEAQEAKKASKKAKQRDRERARKAAMAEKKAASGVSKAEAAEDEVARAALEAAALAQKMYGASVSKHEPSKVSSKAGPSAPDPAKRREVMAAAAEARLKALQAATSSQQLW